MHACIQTNIYAHIHIANKLKVLYKVKMFNAQQNTEALESLCDLCRYRYAERWIDLDYKEAIRLLLKQRYNGQ